MSGWSRKVVRFYNGRETAEQCIKESKYAVKWTRRRISNVTLEGMNNKIRLLSHRAYGFHSAPPLIATIYLCCGGITLPDLQLV